MNSQTPKYLQTAARDILEGRNLGRLSDGNSLEGADAWLLEAWSSPTLESQLEGLMQVLEVDPDNELAQHGIAWIEGVSDVAQSIVFDVDVAEGGSDAEFESECELEEGAEDCDVSSAAIGAAAGAATLFGLSLAGDDAEAAAERKAEEEAEAESQRQAEEEAEAKRKEEEAAAERKAEEEAEAESQRQAEEEAEAKRKEEEAAAERKAEEEAEAESQRQAEAEAEEEAEAKRKEEEAAAERKAEEEAEAEAQRQAEEEAAAQAAAAEANADEEEEANDDSSEIDVAVASAFDAVSEESISEVELVAEIAEEEPFVASAEAAEQQIQDNIAELSEEIHEVAAETPADIVAAAVEPATEGTPDASTGDKLLVLAVDDSPTIRKLVSLTLEREGFEVITACDGLEAVQLLSEHMPDIILSDVNMPRLDGYKLCRFVKKCDRTKHIPVIMLSGKDGVFDKLRGKMFGCGDYVTKPFDSAELIEKVRIHTGVHAS